MYSNDAITHGKIKWRSLLICWLIILAGYLMIRMVFLVFGLQLHLTAQGVCLALLPYCFGALFLWKRCTERKPLFYALGILLPAIVEKLALYFLGAYLCGVSPFRVTAVMEASRMRCSLHGCPCGMHSICCSLTGHILFAASPSLHSAFWACPSCKSGRRMNYKQDVGAAECYPVSDCLSCNQYYLQA